MDTLTAATARLHAAEHAVDQLSPDTDEATETAVIAEFNAAAEAYRVARQARS